MWAETQNINILANYLDHTKCLHTVNSDIKINHSKVITKLQYVFCYHLVSKLFKL